MKQTLLSVKRTFDELLDFCKKCSCLPNYKKNKKTLKYTTIPYLLSPYITLHDFIFLDDI